VQNIKKTAKEKLCGLFGGDKRDRTADLLNAIQALSQLSYTPKETVASATMNIIRTSGAFVNSFFRIFDA
jgi:hypothetical protein